MVTDHVEEVDLESVVDLTQRLVRVDTVNPPGNEAAAAELVGEYLERHGLDVEYQRFSPQRANLVARIRGEAPDGHLALSGHLDVVHPGAKEWASPPFAAERKGDRLVGRGTADMKGGVASMAVAAASLAGRGFHPKADLILAISAGEEVDTVGARHMAGTGVLRGTSMLVVGEPTGLDVFVAEKGVLWPRVTAHGRTAHGSMPQLGVNAITFISHLIRRLEGNPFPFEASPILGEPTVSVNTIEGGVKVNVVPDRCSIEVDMRLVPGQDRTSILNRLDAILDEVRTETGLDIHTEVEVLQDMPPVELPKSDPFVRQVVEVVAAVRGSDPEIGGVSFGTDGAVLGPALNAKLVILGPGKLDQLHQTNEYVDIEELGQATKIYMELAHTLLGAG